MHVQLGETGSLEEQLTLLRLATGTVTMGVISSTSSVQKHPRCSAAYTKNINTATIVLTIDNHDSIGSHSSSIHDVDKRDKSPPCATV